MALIKQLKDVETNTKIYPITHLDAVKDTNGKTVRQIINDLGTPNSIDDITATESAVSGGNNVITITETNGTTTTFNIKNGLDGQDGQDGADGADGVDLGEVALVQTTGDATDKVMSQNAVTEYGRKVTAEDLDGTSDWIKAKLTEEGWEFGKYVASSGNLGNSNSYCASPFIPISNIQGHSMTICYMYNSWSTSCFCFYDSNKAYISGLYYAVNSNNLRTITVGTSSSWDNVAYVRMTCNPNKLPECYIKDNTTDEYLFSARNDIAQIIIDRNFVIPYNFLVNYFVSQVEGNDTRKVLSQDAISGLGFANRFTNNIKPCKGITVQNVAYYGIGLKLSSKQIQLLENTEVITIRLSSKKFLEDNNYSMITSNFQILFNSAGAAAGLTSCGVSNSLTKIGSVRYYPDHVTFVLDMANGITKLYWEKTLLNTFTDDGYKKETLINSNGVLNIMSGNTQFPFVLYQFDVYDGDITPVLGIKQMKDYMSFDSIPPIIKGNYALEAHDGIQPPNDYGTVTGYTVVKASASVDGWKHITSTSSTQWYPAGYYVYHARDGRLTKYIAHIEVVTGSITIGLRSIACNSTTPTVINESTGLVVDASNVGVGSYKVVGWGYGTDTWSLKYLTGAPMEVLIKNTDYHVISCTVSLDCRNLYAGQLYDKEVDYFYPQASTLNHITIGGSYKYVNPIPSYEEFNPVETSVSSKPGHTGQLAIASDKAYISVNKDTWKQINNS